MRKIIASLLAVSLLLCFAGCNKEKTPETTEPTIVYAEDKTLPWPDNIFFKDIPGLDGEIKNFKDSKNDKGYVYEITADGVDYKAFCEYIAKLEAVGFSIYKSSPLSSLKTEDMLPEKLEKDVFNASWSGSRSGLYVAAFWYGDEYYEKNNLPKDRNVRLTFYTYNAFNID